VADPKKDAREDYISPNRAGMIAGVSGEAVKQWIYGRKLPAVKLPNGYWRISESDLESYLARRRQPSKMRVLVASSDASLAKAARAALSDSSFDVVAASNTIDALMKAVDGKPSVIFIDLTDGNIDGLELARKLRSTRGFRRLPVVFISTKRAASGADAKGLLAVRAQGLLIKPLSGSDIAAEIGKIFPTG